jgi:hypothetical protein
MPVKYDNKFIIPAPIVSIAHQNVKTADNRNIGSKFSIDFTGSFLSYFSGIYSAESGNTKNAYIADQALTELLNKQNELLNLFSTDGKQLEIIGIDSGNIKSCYPIVSNISFGEGDWAQKCSYTINLTAPEMYSSGMAFPSHPSGETNQWYLQTLEDSYKMENNYNGTATITRNINAKGDTIYDSGNPGQLKYGIYPWQHASGWCQEQDSTIIEPWYSGIINISMTGWNVIDSKSDISVDPYEGNYSIERAWIISNVGVYLITKRLSQKEE